MPPQQYLSTDPNAGQAAEAGDRRYLSTDPNAGSASPEAGAPEEKTALGFLGNVVSSGANFVGNTVQGLDLVGRASHAMGMGGLPLAEGTPFSDQRLINAIKPMVGGGDRMMSGAAEYFSKRYGSMAKAGETLYEDPVGMAADASTVLSLGGTAAARAPGVVGRIGQAVSAAGAAADPAALAARTAGAVIRPGARAGEAVAGMLDNVPASTAPVSTRDLALGGVTGMMSGDPYTAMATTAGSALLRSPMARHAAASGLRGTGRVLTRTAQTADANSELLTRLAVMAQLQGQ